MQLAPVQIILTVLAVALGAMATRFTPFVLFPEGKQPPQIVTYLGSVLPPVMMGLLVVYCLKDISIQVNPHGLPELISIAFIVFIHLWRKNVLLSIGCGTALHMFLVQAVFVVS
ncbi:MAG: branched-chain amino acid transporter permease [Eubacteriales bacterium]|jgi:branched-subunit amino acid transport protein AzlD|nr:branched-chain amino acid transporter permease [Eubacteriales bacterium]